MTYRADIDGLRAISVLLVLLFHLGLTWLPGGFIGVDVFFVISGYLMTRVLVDESAAGNFSILGFYARRCRRILPALFVVLLTVLLFGYKLLMPSEYEALGRSAFAAALSYSNIFFYFNTGYFDVAADAMPLLHTWSLGVEEQFYLVWPALLMAAWWLFKRTGAAVVVVVCLVIGLAVSVWAVDVNQKAAFYLLHARLWELAAGGALVFWRRPPLPFASLAGLILIVGASLVLTKVSPFPGVNALAPVIGAMMIIASPSGLAARALALPPLRFIGKISYSLYLWHWPIIVFWREYNNRAPDPGEAAAIFVVAVAVAWLSWRYVEQPFRRSKVTSGRTISYSLSAAALVAFTGFGVAALGGIPSRLPGSLVRLDPQVTWSFSCPHSADSIHNNCAVGADWSTAHSRGLLWGDSQATHLLPLLNVAGMATGRSIAFFSACPPPLGRAIKSTYTIAPLQIPDRCAADRAAGIAMLKRYPEIEFVIFASRYHAFLDRFYVDDEPASARSMAHGLQLARAEMQATIDEIRAMGRQIVLISGPPEFDRDPGVPCAALVESSLWRNTKSVCSQPVDSIPLARVSRQMALSDLYDDLARSNSGVFSLSPARAMCNQDKCPTYIGNEFLYRDPVHFRRNLPNDINVKFSAMLGLEPVLTKLGGNAWNLTEIPPDICTRAETARIRPQTAFLHHKGYAYLWLLPDYANSADSNEDSMRSRLVMCENDRLLGPAHSLHKSIIESGEGRYSHYGGGIFFSASDNSDPNSNGRSYRIIDVPVRNAAIP